MNLCKTLLIIIAMFCNYAFAGPTSDPLEPSMIRPYISGTAGGGEVYIHFDLNTFCGTDVFKIVLANGGAQEAYTAALAALMSNKKIRIEVSACNGWGTEVRSIYIAK